MSARHGRGPWGRLAGLGRRIHLGHLAGPGRPGRLALLVLPALLAACGTTVQLVPEPLGCPVPAEVLAQRCDEPAAVGSGATFEQVLQAGGRDRDALRQCGLLQRTLAQALRDCDQSLARYREELRAINQRNSSGR